MKKILLITMLSGLLYNISYADCKTNIVSNAPNNRYQLLNNDAEVKDLKTNLIWQRCSVGQTWGGIGCTGTASKHTWQAAMQIAQNADSGWRIPNIKELASLVDHSCSNPSINASIFPDTVHSLYWTSTPSHGINAEMLIVGFGSGIPSSYRLDQTINVRLVRTEQ